MYKVILNTAGTKYEAQGESVEEALGVLGLTWEKIKAKGVMNITRGAYTYEHLFLQKTLRRMFANKLVRQVWGKRLELLLNEKSKETA